MEGISGGGDEAVAGKFANRPHGVRVWQRHHSDGGFFTGRNRRRKKKKRGAMQLLMQRGCPFITPRSSPQQGRVLARGSRAGQDEGRGIGGGMEL